MLAFELVSIWFISIELHAREQKEVRLNAFGLVLHVRPLLDDRIACGVHIKLELLLLAHVALRLGTNRHNF